MNENEDIFVSSVEQKSMIRVNPDSFMIFANMYRELKNLYSIEEIMEFWKENRNQICKQDQSRDKILEGSYLKNISGFQKIEKYIHDGGVIYSFHYGNYRAIYAAIAEVFYYKYPKKILNIIIDKISYEEEPEKYKKQRNIRYIISEKVDVGIEMIEQLNRGNFVAIFLDGNSGYGVDRNPITIDFLTSKIKIRSGIFRIMSKTKKPLFPIIAEGDYQNQKFEVGDNINVGDSQPQELADKCYEILREKMRRHPEYWRLWFRHNKQILQWNQKDTENYSIANVFMVHGEKKIGLNLKNGKYIEL